MLIIIKCIKLFNLPRNNADPGRAAAQLSECRAGGRGHQTAPSGPAAPYLRTAKRRRPAAAAPPAARSSVPAASPRIHAGAAARSPRVPPAAPCYSAAGRGRPAPPSPRPPGRARPREVLSAAPHSTAPHRATEGSARGRSAARWVRPRPYAEVPFSIFPPGALSGCPADADAPQQPNCSPFRGHRIAQVGKDRYGREVRAPLLHHPVI